ncbi:hypothetical protein GCM10010178_89200 [Lentzea flava]|uniref:Transposase IS110-like N-terminal domain-containing protein n=1 Tax=Lentzea flava TaxID=103732 RepID=A0ABQ2VG66_9PSEU|nr:hypothetical protein [Lentzea flava]MCP2205285.1 Transposase [Lentzea flava]GGU85186.1 hypothetical protein GCM10010178_89200 [Lentzea flava]
MPDPHTPAHIQVFAASTPTPTPTTPPPSTTSAGYSAMTSSPPPPDGHAALRVWLAAFGPVTAVGVEGTGSYGKQLAAFLRLHHVQVTEVTRPDRRTRRSRGKSDAISAARAVLSADATATPKTSNGPVESVRALRVVRGGAVKARTAALNELTNLITTALRETLRDKRGTTRLRACRTLEPDLTQLADPTHAIMLALRTCAERITSLTQQITQLDKHLDRLVATTPTLVALLGFGTDTAGQLLTAAGDNPTGCTAKVPSPSSAASPRSRHPPDAPTNTASTEAATGKPTAPCTSSPSSACATAHAPAPTCNDAPNKD